MTVVTESGNCFNCNKEVGADDYCYGCTNYVCDECSLNMNAGGFGHDPEDHLDDEMGWEFDSDLDDDWDDGEYDYDDIDEDEDDDC